MRCSIAGFARCARFPRRCVARSPRSPFLYRWTLPDCILPTATSGYDDFEIEVERLRRVRIDVVAFDLLRPIYDHGGGARPARRRDPLVARRSCDEH